MYFKIFLIQVVGYAVSLGAIEEHLGAADEIKHNLIQHRLQSILLHMIEVYLWFRDYLQGGVSFGKWNEASDG